MGPWASQAFLSDLENRKTFAATADVDDTYADDMRFVVSAFISRPPSSGM
jgi:hypothetical protein